MTNQFLFSFQGSFHSSMFSFTPADISNQPKAAGSSTVLVLAQFLAQHALRISGLHFFYRHLLILPTATGMAIALTLLSLKASRPKAKYVIWPRIDQKSCLKVKRSSYYFYSFLIFLQGYCDGRVDSACAGERSRRG